MSDSPWKVLNSKTAYENKWYRVIEHDVIRPDGKEGIYAVVETPPSVFTIALTEKDELYLVYLYRFTSKKYSWELPAGSTDGNDPLESAKRELKEETGLKASSWEKVGSFFPLNGLATEETFVFIARDLEETGENKMKEEGIEEIRKVPLEDAFNMIKKGEITDGQTIAALTQAKLYLQNK